MSDQSQTTPCLICDKPVRSYEPQYCCNGYECGCLGRPTNPCICSDRCHDALQDPDCGTMEERRIRAGIALWTPGQAPEPIGPASVTESIGNADMIHTDQAYYASDNSRAILYGDVRAHGDVVWSVGHRGWFPVRSHIGRLYSRHEVEEGRYRRPIPQPQDVPEDVRALRELSRDPNRFDDHNSRAIRFDDVRSPEDVYWSSSVGIWFGGLGNQGGRYTRADVASGVYRRQFNLREDGVLSPEHNEIRSRVTNQTEFFRLNDGNSTLLGQGDVRRAGDRYWSHNAQEWFMIGTNIVGQRYGGEVVSYIYRRPIPQETIETPAAVPLEDQITPEQRRWNDTNSRLMRPGDMRQRGDLVWSGTMWVQIAVVGSPYREEANRAIIRRPFAARA